MRERKLLERFYEKTLIVDTEKSAARAKAAIRAAQGSTPAPRRSFIQTRRLIVSLSICVLLIAAIPMLLVNVLKEDSGGALPPVIPPVQVLPVGPPQKHYYENGDLVEKDITAGALAELYNGKIDLSGFNLTKITLFCPKEKPAVNLFIQITYDCEQSEEFPAFLSNNDKIMLKIVLEDNAEIYWEEDFKDELLCQRLQFFVSGGVLDVEYCENWNEESFAAQAEGKFILNGKRYYINADYVRIPGLTTENLLEDIIKDILGLA